MEEIKGNIINHISVSAPRSEEESWKNFDNLRQELTELLIEDDFKAQEEEEDNRREKYGPNGD